MAIPCPVLEVETIPHGSLVASTAFRYGTRLREDYTREVLLLDFISFATTCFGTSYTIPRLAIGYHLLDTFRGALFARLTTGDRSFLIFSARGR
jgi:hypothetical protein